MYRGECLPPTFWETQADLSDGFSCEMVFEQSMFVRPLGFCCRSIRDGFLGGVVETNPCFLSDNHIFTRDHTNTTKWQG